MCMRACVVVVVGRWVVEPAADVQQAAAAAVAQPARAGVGRVGAGRFPAAEGGAGRAAGPAEALVEPGAEGADAALHVREDHVVVRPRRVRDPPPEGRLGFGRGVNRAARTGGRRDRPLVVGCGTGLLLGRALD